LYEQKVEQVDKLTELLVRGTSRLTVRKKMEHETIHNRLIRNHPRVALLEAEKKLDRSQKDIRRAMMQILIKKQNEFDRVISTLQALSPLKIMDRGYSIVYKDGNRLVKSINQVKEDESIQIQLTDGSLTCHVQSIKESENP
jgi:exodeoxyribonuclease VII large subunit